MSVRFAAVLWRAAAGPLLAVLAGAPLARAADKPPPAYVSAASLAADAEAGPDPFAWAPPGRAVPPPPAAAVPPANVAHLALLRPYSVTFAPPPAAVVEPPNPFLPADAAPPPKMDVPKDVAADWYHPWPVTWTGTAWDALRAAWAEDAPAVRKAFREEARRDWPLEGTSAADEKGRIAAARWVEARWNAAVQARIAAWKAAGAMRGPVLARAPMDASLSALAAGGAANHPAPLLSPRVTADPWVNRYGVGFLLRITADLGRRIPWPVFDFSALDGADVAWGTAWLDEAVRNGTRGIGILPPKDPDARAALEAAVKPLDVPNVYLPPPSEIGVFVSRGTLAREPGAWMSLFRTYAALRAAGLWPDFVSDEQVRSGEVSLARFNLLVVPAARWATAADRDALLARAERGGCVVLTDPSAFGDAAAFAGWKSVSTRRDDPAAPDAGAVVVAPAAGVAVRATFRNGAPAITERTAGDGTIIASVMPMTEEGGAWASFWRDAARRAGVPSRPWLDAVTMANVRTVTGVYQKPSGE